MNKKKEFSVIVTKRPISVPHDVAELIKKHAFDEDVSPEVIIQRTLCNEMFKPEPFKGFVLEVDPNDDDPKPEFTRKLYEFMKEYSYRYFSFNNLINYRYMFAIKEPKDVGMAYYQLLKRGLIYEFTPPKTRFGYVYPEKYKVAMLTETKKGGLPVIESKIIQPKTDFIRKAKKY